MTAKTIALQQQHFFHARPAAIIAAAAKSYESVIFVALGVELADAKDPLALMRLSRPGDAPVELFADGPDETYALEGVASAMKQAFSLMP